MRISVHDFMAAVLPDYEYLTLIAGDASFRKYYRTAKDGINYIVMDAPPAHEDARLFSQVATAFAQAGINVPDIIEDDLEHGYLLLSDFGDEPLQQVISSNPTHWLPICLDTLFDMQLRGGQHILELPPYDDAVLLRELSLFPEWFITELLGEKLTDDEESQLLTLNRLLIDSAVKQPQTWVHRDYHSRNLMKIGEASLGVIDFQDAVLGAITYDLVSLLKDCYVRYPKDMIEQQLQQYYIRLVGHDLYHQDFEQFKRDFDYMGLQRHLKVLGIFSRLCIRDGKPAYLNDLPLVFDYVFEVLNNYSELACYLPLFARLGHEFEHKVLS